MAQLLTDTFPLHEVFISYGALLQTSAQNDQERKRWQDTPKGLLALIILFDQLGRHIHRYQARKEGGREEGEGRAEGTYPSAGETDALALSFARHMQAKGWLSPLHLTVPEHVFALMPFRHSPTIDR